MKKTSHKRLIALLLGIAVLAAACGSDDLAFDGPEGDISIVVEEDVAFIKISPFARFGSGQGDFTTGAHGTFGIFGAAQASPPHTHSGRYYAVVLEGGEMNNPFGTEEAAPTLPAGSFWSVPADEEHVTACLDPNQECNFFFHAPAAFDFFPLESLTEERSDVAQAIPLDELSFSELDPFEATAVVWGEPKSGPFGLIARVEAGENTGDFASRNGFTLVPVSGELEIAEGDAETSLLVGALLEVEANTPLNIDCASNADCIFYLFSDQLLDINS